MKRQRNGYFNCNGNSYLINYGGTDMSKYDALWKYVSETGKDSFKLSYEDIENVAGVSIDHSFLTYKKELTQYGYKVGKISMKEQTVEFIKE